MVQKMGGKVMQTFSDSMLVVGQVRGELEARDLRMQGYLNQVRHLQSTFESFSLSQILRSRNTHADFLATLTTSLAQSLPRVILVEDLCKPTEVVRNVAYSHQIRVGPSWMDLRKSYSRKSYCSLRRISYSRKSQRLTRCEERLLGFGCLRTKSCTIALFLGYIYYAYTLRYQSYSWKSYIKGSMGATQEANLCFTEPPLRDIGSQTYRRKYKSI